MCADLSVDLTNSKFDDEEDTPLSMSFGMSPEYADMLTAAALPMYEAGGKSYTLIEKVLAVKEGKVKRKLFTVKDVFSDAQYTSLLPTLHDSVDYTSVVQFTSDSDTNSLFAKEDIKGPTVPVTWTYKMKTTRSKHYFPMELVDGSRVTSLTIDVKYVDVFDDPVPHEFTYRPTFKVYRPEATAITLASRTQIFLMATNQYITPSPLPDLVDIANTHYFGTSGVQGMIGRLKKGAPVQRIARTLTGLLQYAETIIPGLSKKSKTVQKDNRILHAFIAYMSLASRSLNASDTHGNLCNPYSFSGTDMTKIHMMYGPTQSNQDFMSLVEEKKPTFFLGFKSRSALNPEWQRPFISLLAFKPASSAGLLIPGKHRDVKEEEVESSNCMLRYYSKLNEKAPKDIRKVEAALYLSKASPKAEVYNQSKFKSVERIIYATNTFAYLPLSMVLRASQEAIKNHQVRAPSRVVQLTGFSPMGNLYIRILDSLLRYPGKDVYFVYSDNLYVAQITLESLISEKDQFIETKITEEEEEELYNDLYTARYTNQRPKSKCVFLWASLDGASMECSCTKLMAMFEALRTLICDFGLSLTTSQFTRLTTQLTSRDDPLVDVPIEAKYRPGSIVTKSYGEAAFRQKNIKKWQTFTRDEFELMQEQQKTKTTPDDYYQQAAVRTIKDEKRFHSYSPADTQAMRQYKALVRNKHNLHHIHMNSVPSVDKKYTGDNNASGPDPEWELISNMNFKQLQTVIAQQLAITNQEKIANKSGFETDFYDAILQRFTPSMDTAGPRLDSTWATYFIRSMVNTVDTVALIGQTQFIVPGLASGTASTFVMNNSRMTIIAQYLVDTGYQYKYSRDIPTLPQDIDDIAKSFGVQLTCESVVIAPLMQGLQLTPSYIHAVDLLGYDFVSILYNDRTVTLPVLSKTRLLKAILFAKFEAKSSKAVDTSSEVKTDYINYMKVATLYIAGGWYYPELAPLLRDMGFFYKSIMRGLEVKMNPADLADLLGNVLLPGKTSEEYQGIVGNIVERVQELKDVPNYQDVIRLYLQGSDVLEDVVIVQSEDIDFEEFDEKEDVNIKSGTTVTAPAEISMQRFATYPSHIPGLIRSIYAHTKPEVDLDPAARRKTIMGLRQFITMFTREFNQHPLYFNPGEAVLKLIKSPTGGFLDTSDISDINLASSIVERLISHITAVPRPLVHSAATGMIKEMRSIIDSGIVRPVFQPSLYKHLSSPIRIVFSMDNGTWSTKEPG